jgi:hypothetical protein
MHRAAVPTVTSTWVHGSVVSGEGSAPEKVPVPVSVRGQKLSGAVPASADA